MCDVVVVSCEICCCYLCYGEDCAHGKLVEVIRDDDWWPAAPV